MYQKKLKIKTFITYTGFSHVLPGLNLGKTGKTGLSQVFPAVPGKTGFSQGKTEP